jgi:hypothetical protein
LLCNHVIISLSLQAGPTCVVPIDAIVASRVSHGA